MIFVLLGCIRQLPPTPLPPTAHPPLPTAPVLSAYESALLDAMYPLPAEVVDDLLTLTADTPGVVWDDSGRVLVTSWSRNSYYADPAFVPGYAFPLYGETWFTAADEVADACRGLTGEALSLRVEQLLGLPAGGGRDVFLQVWIDPAALARPCADPDITASSCPIDAPMVATDEGGVYWDCGSDDPHQQWLCETWTSRYGASTISDRYPWTALGYTYDWSDLSAPVGATEFVAASGVEVVLEALEPNEQFCQ